MSSHDSEQGELGEFIWDIHVVREVLILSASRFIG